MYPEQPSYVRVGSSWKTIESLYVYKSGEWKRVNQGYVYRSGAWKRFYAYDSIAPVVQSFQLTDTVSGATFGSTKTSANYRIIFSEPISGFNESMVSFFLNPLNEWSIASVTNPSLDNRTYLVSISCSVLPSSGTVTLQVNPTGVLDTALINAWSGSPVLSQSFSIDTTRPSVSEFESSSTATSTTVFFTLRFSEPVTGIDSSDFTIGGTSSGWQISSVTGSGAVYTITLTETSTGVTTNGTLTLSIPQNVATDAIGNTGPISSATSSEFTVARNPAQPSITSISSSDLTLHDRRINFTASIPAGLTTIKEVMAYLYNSNDIYTGISKTIDVTDSTGPFTTSSFFDVGRNPGTKYYVRVVSRNTFNLDSPFSARSEITTGADKTPPVLAAPSLSATQPTDPGSSTNPLRNITYSFASPSSYLTSEVGEVIVYLYRTSPFQYVSQRSVLKGAAWTTTAISGSFDSLDSGTSYTVFATSKDIYGGTNSTANSASTAVTTVATQSTTVNYQDSVSLYEYMIANSYSVDSTFSGYPASNADDGLDISAEGGTAWLSSASGNTHNYWSGLYSYDFTDSWDRTGATFNSVSLTSVRIKTGRSQETYVQFYNNNVWHGSAGTDPRNGFQSLAIISSGANRWKTMWTGNVNMLNTGGFRARFTLKGVSYAGFESYGVGGGLSSNVRSLIVEVDYIFTIYSSTTYSW
jgi:hypothetical protein